MNVSSRVRLTAQESCPVCGREVPLATPPGEAHCGGCGHLFWVAPDARPVTFIQLSDADFADELKLQRLDQDLLSQATEAGPPQLLLDLADVTYLSSTALGKLLALTRAIRAAGGKLALCRVRPHVWEMIQITKLDQWFSVHEEEHDALLAF